MTTTVRAAGGADVDAMMVIETSVFARNAWTRQQLMDEVELVGDSRWYAVAEDTDGVVGFGGLYLSIPDADVQTVAVAEHAQGRGIGRQILDALVAHAWSQGCTRIFLEVQADNDPALRVYTSAGFHRIGRRPRYYPDGTDAVTMRLRRSEPPKLGEVAGG